MVDKVQDNPVVAAAAGKVQDNPVAAVVGSPVAVVAAVDKVQGNLVAAAYWIPDWGQDPGIVNTVADQGKMPWAD